MAGIIGGRKKKIQVITDSISDMPEGRADKLGRIMRRPNEGDSVNNTYAGYVFRVSLAGCATTSKAQWTPRYSVNRDSMTYQWI